MPRFTHEGIDFHYVDEGTGLPFVFQHGLGGDVGQPMGLLKPMEGVRCISLDCRAHGQTRPLGDPSKLSIAQFAEDLAELLARLRIEQAVVGGISLGAAVALRFALGRPDTVLGLVLSRPAWLAGPNRKNAATYASIARRIRELGALRGREDFLRSPEYAETLAASPDAAASLLGQFENPRAEETVAKLERIPQDAPVDDLRRLETLDLPALVLANRQDPIHPFEFGRTLTAALPQAELRELTPKSVSKEDHAADVQRWIGTFLERIQKEPSRRRTTPC